MTRMATEDTPPLAATPHGPAGRPRNASIDAAVLRATQDLLVERGLSGMTVGAVARAAGSGKAAVYRRWSSKTELVVAAVRALYDPPEVPDTGTLRGDLVGCALFFARPDDRSARVLASLLGELAHDEELRDAAYRAIGEPPAAAFGTVLQRWAAKGEIPAEVPLPLLVGILPAYAFRSIAFGGHAIDEQTALDLVDHVLLPALQLRHREPSRAFLSTTPTPAPEEHPRP